MQIRRIHPISGSHRGHAVAGSLGLLGLCALVQISLFISLHGRARLPDAKVETPRVPVRETRATPAAAVKPEIDPAAVLPDTLPADEPILVPSENLAPVARFPRTPLVAKPEAPPAKRGESLAPTDPSAVPRDDVRTMLAEAIRLRRSGDMAGAVAKLNAALDILPGHPRLLFEMAATYEAMGMTEKASEDFRKVADLGQAGAGALWSVAERRLKDGLTVPGAPSVGGDPLYFGNFEEIRGADGPGQSIVVRFDVHSLPGAKIEPSGVFLPVRFFDLVDGKRVEPSRADPPKVEWTSSPVDWKEPGIETVEVTYHLPPPADGGERKYLGYLVELYYQDALLDVVARPRRLARYQVQNSPADEPAPPSDALPATLGGTLLETAPPSR